MTQAMENYPDWLNREVEKMSYIPIHGTLINSPNQSSKETDTGNGYKQFRLSNPENRKEYFVIRSHRIVFKKMTGKWPPAHMVIDHIDQNRENNRWDNLQLLTTYQNMMRSVALANSTYSESTKQYNLDKGRIITEMDEILEEYYQIPNKVTLREEAQRALEKENIRLRQEMYGKDLDLSFMRVLDMRYIPRIEGYEEIQYLIKKIRTTYVTANEEELERLNKILSIVDVELSFQKHLYENLLKDMPRRKSEMKNMEEIKNMYESLIGA